MYTLSSQPQQSDGLVLPWLWCRCCQRAFVQGTYRRRHIARTLHHPHGRLVRECPYLGCWGQIVRDSSPWPSIRRAHPEYPEQPERYVVYVG